MSVRDAIQLIQKKKSELRDQFSYVYAVNHQEELTGVLQLRDLLLADPSASVNNIMNPNPIFLRSTNTDEEINALFRKYPLLALPMVDESQKLIGVLPAQRQTGFPKIGSNRFLQYFTKMGNGGEEIEGQSIFKIVSRRLPWLLLSIITGLMCAYILGIFIEEIESIVALVLFIPIVLGVAGGVGVQSSVITARGLTKGNLRLSELGCVLAKETAIGFWIGVSSCVVITLISILWHKSLVLGLALGVSVIACVAVSGLTGIFLPLIFRIFRMNPAFASGFFVLIICDIFVMIVYFSLSSAIINPSF